MITVLKKLRIRLLGEDSSPHFLLTTDAEGNVGKVAISTDPSMGGGVGGGGCGCRTIDGGAPDTVYLPTQNIEGGTPGDVGEGNNHIDGGYYTL